MTDIFDWANALAEREAGIAQAAKHAEELSRGWSDQAYEWIKVYSRTNRRFISEQCTAWITEQGFKTEVPKAWGAVFKRAAKDGVIVRVGSGTSLRRHCSPTPLWESSLCQ